MPVNEPKEIDVKGFVRRRRRSFVLCFSSILIAAFFVAVALSPIYLSQSTILIEDQQIPSEYVQTTITGYVEERLQVITQRIMSRSKLMEIIERFGLYSEMRERHTTEEVLEKMRRDINLQTISADVVDRTTGRPTTATIAFTLSYQGKNPPKVQKVANVLASLYLEQNLKTREERVSTTTTFLQQELDELEREIDAIENKISVFKKDHIGELPEYNSLNVKVIAELNRELDHVDMQINSLLERKILLAGQLANVDPRSPIMTNDGKAVMPPAEQLKYLRLQLITLQSRLSDKHPDLVKLKKEIEQLELQVEESHASMEKIKRLETSKAELAAIKGKLGPKHPDIIKLSKEVDALEKEVEHLKPEQVAQELTAQTPDNPAYINLKTQLDSVELQIKSLLEEKRQTKDEIAEYQKRIENAPVVEKEYNSLIRDYESAKNRHNELMNKLTEAKLAQGMEETQRGERFTIIDPALLPEKPYKPNRLAILLIGFVMATGGGIAVAAIRESLDASVKTAHELNRLASIPVLSVISLVESDDEVRYRRIKMTVFVLGVLGVLVGAVLFVHYHVMPMEMLWTNIQRGAARTALF